MKHYRILPLLILLALVSFLAGFYWPHRVVQEDDAEWDCRTMGNQICGPVERGSDK